ncbi:hypothetical protein LguiA_026260 [Lonicera macranthoides]
MACKSFRDFAYHVNLAFTSKIVRNILVFTTCNLLAPCKDNDFCKQKLGSISKLRYIQKSKKNGLALVQHNMQN